MNTVNAVLCALQKETRLGCSTNRADWITYLCKRVRADYNSFDAGRCCFVLQRAQFLTPAARA